jgi:hypothetical protein
MKCFLLLIVIFSVNSQAATFIPYGPFSKTAFMVGEGVSADAARKDAHTNIPNGFQKSNLLSSAILDCRSEARKCKYFLPLEPSDKIELSAYKNLIEHHELETSFRGYGRTIEDAEKDLLLKTGKKSLSAFIGNITRSCPTGFKGPGFEKCINEDAAGNFIAETTLPRSCFLTE